jgi:hypothetical protein
MKFNILGIIYTLGIMSLLLFFTDSIYDNTIMVPGILIVSFFLWRLDLRVLAGLNALLILGVFLQ